MQKELQKGVNYYWENYCCDKNYCDAHVYWYD